MFAFSKSDRVLFVAPHPDDESLGGGGLLQRLFAAGVPVRILFATNGDNNPWAQRFWERRWRIGLSDRMRWGKRRQREAVAAIVSLGGSPECARFLNFRDQSVTSLLMRDAPELFAVFADEIRSFDPTILIIPTILDAHPDHSALGVTFSLVLDSTGNAELKVWEYLVHRPRVGTARRPVMLRLSPSEIERKKQAIKCHETQLALSANRFLRFAKSEESFYAHAAIGIASEGRPSIDGRIGTDGLSLVISALRRERLGSEILLAFRAEGGRMHRWRIRVSPRSGVARIRDLIDERLLGDAIATWKNSNLTVVMPMLAAFRVEALFVKLSSWKVFFDRSGWCQVLVTCDRSADERLNATDLMVHF
jgi:LmbE family N-acetylglucosaminyl deacetylase